MKKILLLCVVTLISSCVSKGSLKEQDGIYLYKGKENSILSFSEEPSSELLLTTGNMLSFIIKQTKQYDPNQGFYIEGLGNDIFVNFMTIIDSLYFSLPNYQNRLLIYGYGSSLYEKFMNQNKQYPLIPLREFEKIFSKQKVTSSEIKIFNSIAVKYAVDSIYFVSILELLERPMRYFYPAKTKEELYRVLIFPEILGFWNFLENRLGKKFLLEAAEKEYTPEEWHIIFGQRSSDTESEFVKSIESYTNSSVLKTPVLYTQYTNTLELYLSGTKKSLMSE